METGTWVGNTEESEHFQLNNNTSEGKKERKKERKKKQTIFVSLDA